MHNPVQFIRDEWVKVGRRTDFLYLEISETLYYSLMDEGRRSNEHNRHATLQYLNAVNNGAIRINRALSPGEWQINFVFPDISSDHDSVEDVIF